MGLSFIERQQLRQARSDALKARMPKRPPYGNHGREATYISGCKCVDCTAASTEARRCRKQLARARALNG